MANGATGEEFRVIKNMLLGAVRGTNENKVERRQERSFAEARLSQPLRLVNCLEGPREAAFSFWLLEFVQLLCRGSFTRKPETYTTFSFLAIGTLTEKLVIKFCFLWLHLRMLVPRGSTTAKN